MAATVKGKTWICLALCSVPCFCPSGDDQDMPENDPKITNFKSHIFEAQNGKTPRKQSSTNNEKLRNIYVWALASRPHLMISLPLQIRFPALLLQRLHFSTRCPPLQPKNGTATPVSQAASWARQTPRPKRGHEPRKNATAVSGPQ